MEGGEKKFKDRTRGWIEVIWAKQKYRSRDVIKKLFEKEKDRQGWISKWEKSEEGAEEF